MAKILHKEKEFIDVIIVTLTPTRACSTSLMDLFQCAPPFVRYSLARAAITVMLSNTDCWDNSDTPYYFSAFIQLITDYCVVHEMSVMEKTSSTTWDIVYYWRQDIIDIAMHLINNYRPSLPVNHCVALCLLAVKFNPTLVASITDFLRQRRINMTIAVQMIKHAALVLEIGVHFTTPSERYIAIALYQQAIDVIEAECNMDELNESDMAHLVSLYENIEYLDLLQQRSMLVLQKADCK
jgi:hypothetical protein